MFLDTEKPVYIKKQFYDAKTGNLYPAGDRPYLFAAIPEKFRTLEYCTQEAVATTKVAAMEKAVDIRPMPSDTSATTVIKASNVIIKEAQLPPSPEPKSVTVEVEVEVPDVKKRR